MLAYCHWLIHNRVFRNVTISFLPVGHTHEDIDQMFSTFRIGMKCNPRVLCVEDFVNGLQQKWYSATLQKPSPLYLFETWDFKLWLDPYICGVKGTSKPHVFSFCMEDDKVNLYTRDYHSSTSPWMGPYEFLTLCPTDYPLSRVPAQLDPTILKDTFSAISALNNSPQLKQSFQNLVTMFNTPPADKLLACPFQWVYDFINDHTNMESELDSFNPLYNASLALTGQATLELTSEKPDDGAIVAVAGDRGAIWLGIVQRTTRTRIYLYWLEEHDDSTWSKLDDTINWVSYNSLLSSDVSLDLNNHMRPALWSRLLRIRSQWPDADV
jgi:hypothetical protein